MNTNHPRNSSEVSSAECDLRCLAYIQAFAHTMRHPCLVLAADLRIRIANEAFCQVFQIPARYAEGRLIYSLGNGQWDIPFLHTLLEEILPKHTFFMGFEISHDFPFLGRKHLILNAHAETQEEDGLGLIFLSIEDMTGIMAVAETITSQIREIGATHTAKTDELEAQMIDLEKKVKREGKRARKKDEL
jgi:hypothetical protein